jgi:hypothetical protein
MFGYQYAEDNNKPPAPPLRTSSSTHTGNSPMNNIALQRDDHGGAHFNTLSNLPLAPSKKTKKTTFGKKGWNFCE